MTKVYEIVLADRRLKVYGTFDSVGISKRWMGHILLHIHEILSMRKLSARWIPINARWVPVLDAV